jgi:putative effector of murein hydrolase LrgA (UPF0299 family)
MNRFIVVFLTIIATLLFSLGIGSTAQQIEGPLPTSITGLLIAFMPFVCGVTSIVIFWIVSFIKDTAHNDGPHREE